MSGFLGKVGEFLGGAGSGIIKQVSEVADTFIQTKDEQDAFKLKLKELEHKVAQESKQLQADIERAYLEDTKSARNMQIAALQQEDTFSKRFVYYLAIFWSVVGSTYLFMATFSEVINPKMADTVLGFLLGTIVATIINFFFGSSRGSQKKDEGVNIKQAIDAMRK